MNVNPDKGSGFWTFTVQSQNPDRVLGPSPVEDVQDQGQEGDANDQPEEGGSTVLLVNAKYGYLGNTSTPVTLVK